MVITWYGAMYVIAFWLAWAALPLLGKMRGVILTRDQWTSIVAFGALGVVAGGRIGYAILYEPLFFLEHPFEIIKIWHGGMSSHGGFIGVAVALWLYLRTSSPSLLLRKEKGGASSSPLLTKERLGEVSAEGGERFALLDVITVPAAFGLALGRIGNIINQEFGMYPYYEAAGDVVIAIVCYVLLRATNPLQLPLRKGERRATPPFEGGARGGTSGVVFAIFLLLYSILRFSLEYIRPQEWSLIWGLSRGQLFTIPLLFVAVILLHNALKHRI